tara:strand:+ start:1206 stop:3503 length:2298 start_codon:yes stop_codon:yes gene_type:complete
MQELILYIKPKVIPANQTAQKFERVDLIEAELITLTQVIQDVKEIDKIFTDFSRTFNLPASKVNNKIFQHWYNDDVIGFDNHIMSDAIIELNHLPFKIGQIKLESVVMKNNRPSLYKVTFFGNTVSLNNLIGEDKLEDLNWLSNFDFLNTFPNILDGFKNGLDVTVDSVNYTDAIIYPLLTHTQSYIYDSGGQFDNFTNIAFGTDVNDDRRGVFPEDLKPAIKVSLVLKAIEQQYGLTFKTSEFFDSSVFTNMYLWLHREKGKIDQTIKSELIINTSFTCTNPTVLGQDLTNPIDKCTFFANTTESKFNNGKFEIQKTEDFFYYSYLVEITPTVSTQEYTIEVIDDLTGETLAVRNGTGAQSLTITLDTVDDKMQIGDKKNLITKISSNNQLTFTSQFAILVVEVKPIPNDLSITNFYTLPSNYDGEVKLGDYDSSSIGGNPINKNLLIVSNFQSGSLTTANENISIRNNTPKISVLNFLKGLFKMHNLTAFVNTDNEIVVKTLDDFYSGDTIDISKFVVTDQHTVEANLPFTEVDFQYKEPKTILAQQFLQTNNKRFGELEFKTTASDEKIYLVEAPFEHMMFERLNDQSDGSQTDIQYGAFIDDDLNPSIGAPLLFYGVYQENISKQINYVETTRPESGTPSTGTQRSINDYWMPSNYNELGASSTPPAFNLNFGSEINEYNLTDYGGVNNSLFEKYYTNYITRIFNKKTRLYKLKAILPLKELLKISLDDKIIVGTREFTINKMTTKLQSGETQFELLSEAP